ncbi:type II secretion system F family protein [Ornithinicoccus hortensis]|uniref:type II secretion system F family protein n=1 Tax=Ornithinicoccus hortensis TaxID=82346 RepID=UPI001478FFBE|nr:type II secretion system F family protein [Ornithinicoccus hortensis]
MLTLLDSAAAALRTGLPTVEALDVAGAAVSDRVRHEVVVPVVQAAQEGRAVAPVWQKIARRSGDPDLAALGRAWALSERTGAPLADALTTAATVARARLEQERRVEAATAGARATSTLLTLLPVGGMGVGMLLGVSPGALYGTAFAQASLGVGLVTLLLGRVVVRRMVARVTEDE